MLPISTTFWERHNTMLKKLLKQISNDKVRVLMAFVLACFIYALRSDIFSAKTETGTFNVPVILEYPNANIVNLDNNKNIAAVTVEGAAHRINTLTADKISASVEVLPGHLQTGRIELTAKDIKVPLGIRIKKIEPSFLTVNLEEIISKKVPVKPVFDSLKNLSGNYSVSKTTIFPAEVMISGPKSKINDIKELSTTPIPIDNSIQTSFKYNADISAIDGVTMVPSEVKCDIAITQNFNHRIIKKVPIKLLLRNNNKLTYTMKPSEVELEISGPARAVNLATVNDFDVFVNADNITMPGEYTLNIRCAARTGDLKVIAVTPILLTLTAR